MRESHNYGDCYFCGGEVKEKVIEVEFRWKGKLYILEGVPTGVCQQCGEKYFTVQVSEAIDRSINQRRECKKDCRNPCVRDRILGLKCRPLEIDIPHLLQRIELCPD
ncbi:MAG: type II toxin-antitoxin system MqsA family antitoxin [Desulfobacterales bacterium]|jgi:YgiT-type zinc finger domain-containing protein|nr:type II toxin-antitoxin system MqsA family antitoxin [Desulfobacterales bacterium]